MGGERSTWLSVWNQQRDGGRDGWMRWGKEGRRKREGLTTPLGAEGIWTEPFLGVLYLGTRGEQEHLLGGGLLSVDSLSKEPRTQGGGQSQCGKERRVKKKGEGHREGFSERGADLNV